LRAAQLWLREAPQEDCDAMLEQLATLAARHGLDRARVRATRGRPIDQGPFTHPIHWAAFAAYGPS
jgi:CHAT domain-containing protein